MTAPPINGQDELRFSEGSSSCVPPAPSVYDIEPGSPFLDTSGRRHIKPYTNIFKTNVKGRWVGMSLLEVFSREFSVVDTTPDGTSVSTNFLLNCGVYANRMAEGTLLIVGRERECIDAGKEYLKWLSVNMTFPTTGSLKCPKTDEGKGEEDDDKRPCTRAFCAVNSPPSLVFEAMPKLAILRQKDKIKHVVERIEPSIDLSDPNIGGIEIIFVSFPRDNATDSFTLSLIAVNKPSSVSIHPSGRFNKNTLLTVLESAFCGKDNGEERINDNKDKRNRNGNVKHTSSEKNEETFVNSKVPSYLIRDVLVNRGGTSPDSDSPSYSILRTEICVPCYAVSHQAEGSSAIEECSGLLTTEYRPVISMCHDKVCERDRARLIQMLPSSFFMGPIEENRYGTSLHEYNISMEEDEKQRQKTSENTRTCGITKTDKLKLHIVHRLDRCTSGVVIIALDSNSASAIGESFTATTTTSHIPSSSIPSIGDRTPSYPYNAPSAMVTSENCETAKRNKVYLARVHGDFRILLQSLRREERIGCDSLPSPLCPGLQMVSAIIKETNSNEKSNTSKEKTVVIVNGGIYCSSFQQASYWCLSPEEQQVFEKSSRMNDEMNTLETQETDAICNEVTEVRSNAHQSEDKVSTKRSRSISNDTTEAATTISPTQKSNNNEEIPISREEKHKIMRQCVSGSRRINNSEKSDIPSCDTFHGIKGRIQQFDKLKSAVSSFEIVKVVKRMKDNTVQQSSEKDVSDDLDTIIMCVPHTGRTHQLRIHLSALGFPIVGDTKYDHISAQMRKQKQIKVESARNGYAIDEGDLSASKESKYTNVRDPEGICLHALKYTVELGGGKSVCVEATAPSWVQ